MKTSTLAKPNSLKRRNRFYIYLSVFLFPTSYFNSVLAAEAYTPNAQELQLLSTNQEIKYAFFQESVKQVWYIVGVSARPNEAYFLAPFLNGQPGWGIIGGSSRTSTSSVNLNTNTIQINPNISYNAPSNGFQDAFHSLFRTERNAKEYTQLVEGKTFNANFYFFQAGSSWYITHPQNNKVHKFISNSTATNFDWAEVLAPNNGSWKSILSGSSFSLVTVYPITSDLPTVDQGGSELGTGTKGVEDYSLPEVDRGLFPAVFTAEVKEEIASGLPVAGAFKNACTFDDPEFGNSNQSAWSVPYVNSLCSTCIIIGYKEGASRLYKPLRPASLGEVVKVLAATNNYTSLEKCEQLQPATNTTTAVKNYWNCYFTEARNKGLSVDVNNYDVRPVRRGLVMQYIVNLFYQQSMSEQNAATFLANKGILDLNTNYQIEADLLRDQLAKIVLKAAKKTGKTLPYNLCSRPKSLPMSDMPQEAAPELKGSTAGQAAFQNAQSYIGTKSGRGLDWVRNGITYCQRFVRSMLGLPPAGDAIEVCNRYQRFGLIKTSGTPTTGATVCYGAVSGNKYGHISISDGKGNEIGVRYASKGAELTKTPSVKGYMGWIDAQDFVSNYYRK
jgi:hypothetical protein